MTAVYPGALPTFPTYVDDGPDLMAADMNKICDELLAGLTELGTDPAGSLATLKARMLVTIDAAGLPVWGTPTTKTIASGQFTPDLPWHLVDTESAAATDDLDTITAGSDGQHLEIRIVADARNVRIRNGTGNIVTPGAVNVLMDTTADLVGLVYDATISKWIVKYGRPVGISGIDYMQLNTTATGAVPTVAGAVYWNDNDKTLSMIVDVANGVTADITQESHIRVVNKTGSQINDGQVVYISGASGNRPEATLAKSDAIATSRIIGVATQNIADDAQGMVTTFGIVRGYNTSALVAGDKLYLSAATAGLLTKTAPTSPNYLVCVATALDATANGEIFVFPQAPIALDVAMAANSSLVSPSQAAVVSYLAAQLAAAKKYAEFYAYDKAILFQINTTDTYHPFHLITAGDIGAGPLSGWTFGAGRVVDANISTETNPSGSVLLITCSGNHLLTTGDLVVLTNMNNAGHNKVTHVTVTGGTTFTCDDIAYVAGAGASAGVVDEPAYLLAGSGAAGVYAASFTIDGTAAATGKVWKFELNINLLSQDNVVSERYTSGTLTSVSASGLITIADGDKVWLSGKNATDTGDYTIKHANVNVRRV